MLETSNTLRAKAFIQDELDDVDVPDKYKNWSAREVYLKNVKHLLNQV